MAGRGGDFSQDLSLVQIGNVVERLRDLRVVIAQHLLADGQRLLVQRESLRQLALQRKQRKIKEILKYGGAYLKK